MASELVEIGYALAIVVVAVIAGVIKSYKGGYLGRVVDNHLERSKGEMNGKLDEIQRTVEETHDTTEALAEQVDDLGEAIYLLHRDDPGVHEGELREKVGADELATDIFDRDDDVDHGDRWRSDRGVDD